MSASMPSSMYVKHRRCAPPSTSLIGTPYRMLCRNCVRTRLEPFLRRVDVVEMRADPVERPEERVLQPLRVPIAAMTRSRSCLEAE